MNWRIRLTHVLGVALVGVAGLLGACNLAFITIANSVELTTFEVHEDKLYIMNELNSKTFDQIKEVVAQNTRVQTLVFTAMPGSLDDEVTFAMGRWIRERELNTHLTSQSVIASGAVDLFLSGVSRTMEDGAKLGVHSWGNGIKEATDFPRTHKAHSLNKKYITDMGVAESFYWFTIYQAPADKIYWMNNAEVMKFGLLTAPILKTNTAYKIPFLAFPEKRDEILEGE